MAGEIMWLIGAAVAFVGLVGGVVARDRYVMRFIMTENKNTRDATKSDTDALHERVNRVRDEYVRRSDLDQHVMRLDASVKDLATEIRTSTAQTNSRLDAVLGYLAKSKD